MNPSVFQELAAKRPATLEEVDVDVEPITEENVYDVSTLSKGATKIGVLRLRAGYENASEWFAWSTKRRLAIIEWGVQQNPPWNAPKHPFDALVAALFVGDDHLLTEAAQVARQMDTLTGEDSPINTAMSAIVSCISTLLLNDSQFEQEVDNLRTIVDRYANSRDFQALNGDATKKYVSYARFMEGIRDGDQKAITDAIKLMVEYHDEELFEDPEGDHTCIDATILTILAQREGFDVGVESKYIPENLPE